MKYVLDTGAVLAVLKGTRVVVTRLDIAGKEAVSVPQPVWAELTYRLERLPASPRKAFLHERCRMIQRELTRAPWTDEVSEQFGRIKAELERSGTSIEDHAVVMAAHAMTAGAVLVTDDVDRMSCVKGLEVENWER
jgi:tRNA(fMet)-specific endonuclease VapC